MIVGMGIDIIDVERVKNSIDRYGESFIKRVYTDSEIKFCGGRVKPEIAYAGRFAAKEAFAKAIGTGIARGVSWKNIEVDIEQSGKPSLIVRGRALEIARELGARFFHISMTDTKKSAAAVVILEK